MALLKLSPSYKDYLWGGHRLVDDYNKQYGGEVLAESWELSCHPDGPSTIINGACAGKTLEEYIQKEGKDVLGTHCRRFKEFPILIKFIDAKDNLSVQVHPSNLFALKNEGQYGKTEMWYVMDCKEGAYLYYGFKREVSKEEFARRIEEDTLLEVLNAVPVQRGDVLFIEAGTIHAIGKDIVIAEIQQNSNVTYRVYDYGRVGKDGKKRDLHIEKALAVTSRVPIIRKKTSDPHIASCDYFTVDKLNLDGTMMKTMSGFIGNESFASILIMDGKGTISSGGERMDYQKGDSFFLGAGSGSYEVTGTCEALVTSIGEKASPIRIGIEISTASTKIGLVDVNHQLLAEKVIQTQPSRPWQAVIQDIGEQTLALLEKEQIPMDTCIGAGVGAPGTIDTKKGMVRYSNNICWENVPLVEELSKYLPIPIYVGNNADCAALGEVAGGAAKDYQDVVMITLGTGVGSGVILDGKIYEGKLAGGSELGHSVIVEDGELCTCGRRGCLEAYVSTTALIRDAKRKIASHPESMLGKAYSDNGNELTPEMIFASAKTGDDDAKELIGNYSKKLGTGIVNLVNIFRPQLILLGGKISEQGDQLLESVSRELNETSFGGTKGDIPELALASLGSKAGMIGAANLV